MVNPSIIGIAIDHFGIIMSNPARIYQIPAPNKEILRIDEEIL